MRADIREERLRATAGLKRPSDVLDRMTTWRGRSGRRYVVGVHPLAADFAQEADCGVLLAVQRDGEGTAALLDATSIGPATSRKSRLRWIARMRARGATEMHLHLLAEDEAEREAMVKDLSTGA